MKKILVTLGAITVLGIGVMNVGGAPTTTFTRVSDIQTAERNYIKTAPDGKYLQIIPGNQLSPDKTGTSRQKLGKDVPAGIRIDEYESPLGKGYQIYYEDSTAWYSVGEGPEASARNYTRLKPITAQSATSTL